MAGQCGFLPVAGYVGFDKPHFTPTPAPSGAAANITVVFQQVGLHGSVTVYDIWAQKTVGRFTNSYTASVPFHGTAFLRLTSGSTSVDVAED
jgi:hypothetical protein